MCLSLTFTGTSASSIHFQMYLLEGIFRWNVDRSIAAIEGESTIRCYDQRLKDAVNTLSRSVLGNPQFAEYKPPGKYTGRNVRNT